MYSYPPEYLLHPVPVLALYGLTTSTTTAIDETKLVDINEPATPSSATNSTDNSPSSIIPQPAAAAAATTSSGLASSLLNVFTSKPDYTLYEASRYVSSNQVPPPFRVITVSKVFRTD